MSTRSSSLNAYTTLGISREIDSKYDVVKAVAAKLGILEELHEADIDALAASLNEAKDFTGITVVAGDVANWDAVGKVLTVPTLQGEVGPQGPAGESIVGPQGPQGIQGPAGATGKSAYQVAVDNGFTGTQTEWVNSLQGTDGVDGVDGLNGASPIYEFKYNEVTGDLEVELVGYEDVTVSTTVIEEVVDRLNEDEEW